MGAIILPCSSTDDVLQNQSAVLQQWFSGGGQKIEGLVIRKFPSWLEPEHFFKAGSGVQFDTARFRLMMSNTRDIWRVSIEMVFHLKARLLEDGSTAGPGILFNVLDDDGKRVPVDYFAVSAPTSGEPVAPEQWCIYWFRKLAKGHRINRIFAYKEFEAEID